MLKSSKTKLLAAASLTAVMLLCPPVFASYLVPPAHIGKGVVQSINYASNTITVNGHVYRISPKAAYAGNNVKNIGGLQAGMKIQFIADGPVANSHSRITKVMVLPPASQ